MESVYNPYGHAHVTEAEDLNIYFLEYSKYCKTIGSSCNLRRKATIFRLKLGLEKTDYENLQIKFDLKRYIPKKTRLYSTADTAKPISISIDGFKPDYKYLLQMPQNVPLHSLIFLKKRNIEEMHKELKRYNGEVSCSDILAVQNDENKDKLCAYSNYVITVCVYTSESCASNLKNIKKPLQVSQEFIVFGNQTLDALRDRIICAEDYTSCEGDVSDKPFQPSTVFNKDVFKSSMFFINNVFYNDSREKSNIDYSEVIIEWASQIGLNLNKKASMEDTKFNNITFRLGYPYLYLHQANCEHVIVFTDARLVSKNDILVKSAYPLMVSYAILKGNTCFICGKNVSKFIVLGMKKLPTSKCHICGDCLYHYCYINGRKICDFTLYKYVDRVALL